MARIFGISGLTVDGVVLQVKGHVDIDFGTPKNEVITGQDNRVHGVMQSPKPGKIGVTLTDLLAIEAADIFNATDVTVTVTTGQKTYSLPNAAYTGDGTLNSEAGELAAEWSGGTVEEIS